MIADYRTTMRTYPAKNSVLSAKCEVASSVKAVILTRAQAEVWDAQTRKALNRISIAEQPNRSKRSTGFGTGFITWIWSRKMVHISPTSRLSDSADRDSGRY
jgi:hypothetical protein